MIQTMTYWNMRAYSDGDEIRPRTGTADICMPARAQARRREQAEIDVAGISGHVTRTQGGRR
jgi:hypothetical protein